MIKTRKYRLGELQSVSDLTYLCSNFLMVRRRARPSELKVKRHTQSGEGCKNANIILILNLLADPESFQHASSLSSVCLHRLLERSPISPRAGEILMSER